MKSVINDVFGVGQGRGALSPDELGFVWMEAIAPQSKNARVRAFSGKAESRSPPNELDGGRPQTQKRGTPRFCQRIIDLLVETRPPSKPKTRNSALLSENNRSVS